MFFYTPTTPSSIYSLSLHDALPIYHVVRHGNRVSGREKIMPRRGHLGCIYSEYYTRIQRSRSIVLIELRAIEVCGQTCKKRSEEHTSELQSRGHLVCRLLLEKKNSI